LLVLTIILNPEGIVGPAHVLADRLRRQRLGEVATIDPMLDPMLHPASRAKTAPAVPAAVAGRVLLSLRGVGVRYGGVVAVDDVSLDVPEGLIVGLIGPNGAGKTTLMDAISGFTPSTGTVEFEGVPINGAAPFRRVRRGLGRTFQGIELYEDLTVEENISVGEEAARHGGDHLATTAAPGLDDLIGLLHLDPVRDRPVSDLSAGYRQLVSIGRALAGRPRLVLLDEPAGGLDSDESLWLGERLRAIRDSGVTVVMIDHDMHLVLGVCDLIHVLDLGSLIASGTPAQIQGDPKVAAAYLGSTHAPEEVAG
jgi:ABC-type branched-subunit amino acid transport system ATPase component